MAKKTTFNTKGQHTATANAGQQTKAAQSEKAKFVPAWGKLTPWISATVFAVLAWVMLVVNNSDYLYLSQERSLFSDTEVFFNERMQTVQGLLQWAGCYLTQFFYHPALGASLLIGLWLLTFYAMKRAFGIGNRWSFVLLIPVVALLCSIIDLGYWVYYLKSPGYWFTQSLGVLVTVLAVWVGNVLEKRGWMKLAWIAVWTAVGYAFLGWFALLGTVLMTLKDLGKHSPNKLGRLVQPVVAVLLVAGVPFVYYHIYTNIRIEDLWTAGMPLFNSEKKFSYLPMIPFFIVAASLEAFAVAECFKALKDSDASTKMQKGLMAASIATMAICVWATNAVNFDDHNYHAEMRMYRAVDEQRWNDALEEMTDLPDSPTRQMVLMKNIALMNTGELGTKMFKYDNTGKAPHIYDSLYVHMVQTAGAMIYYQHGKANFAYRWCVENGVEFGYNIDHLKLMTQCAMVSNEPVLAMKYINILKTTKYHKEWAMKYEKMIMERTDLSTTPEFGYISHLRNFSNITDGDQGMCEMYILNYFANTMNKEDSYLQELTLAYSLIQKDIQLFWPRFFLYATLNENKQMPIHYQEAAYLYGHLEKQVDISKMPFDKERIVNRYNQFGQISQAYLRQGMSTDQVGQAMKASFGDTFWWFYYFCNDVKTY